MPQQIASHCFENGLTLIVESMPHVQSAAFSFLVPAGSLYDPPGKNGSAAVLSDLITRGAGTRDAKELSSALDNLGVQRSESPGVSHIAFSGATLSEKLPEALGLYRDILLEPHLPADQFEPARAGAAQSLRALEDEPRQKIYLELRKHCYDAPWGLPTEGTLQGLEALTVEVVRNHYERCFRPQEAILGIAGNIEFQRARDVVGSLFDHWQPKPQPRFTTSPRGPQHDHIPHDSTQTHIGIAYEAVPYRSPDYYAAWASVSILSGGMSSRLFTEVREKRGLCYAVSATLNSLRDEARVLCYAGTTNDRAQETLAVTLGELQRLGEGLAEDELQRCKARAKSSLVMQQESTMARSSAIARDWYHLGCVRTLDEVRERIDALTVESVLKYVHEHPARDFTVLTIGPQPLEVPNVKPRE